MIKTINLKSSTAIVAFAALLAACSGGSDSPAPPSPPANRAPAFSSPSAVTVPENTTAPVMTVAVSDPDGDAITLTLGGPDAALFTLNSARELRFVTPPDFESPADADGDNIYRISITASDGQLTTTLSVAVTIENVDEFPVGIASLNFYENANTGNIALVEAEDGSSFSLFGERAETGLPTSLDGFQFSLPDPDDSAGTIQGTAFKNPQGKLARLVYNSGETFELVYNATGLSALIYTSADGLTKESVQVPKAGQPEAGPAGAGSNNSIASRTLLNIRSGQPLRLLSSGNNEPAAGPAGQVSKEVLSSSLANTQPVNVQVSECGRPISGADVLLYRSGISSFGTHFAREVSPGLYRTHFPVDAAPGPAVEEACNTTREFVSAAGGFCAAGPEVYLGIFTICPAFLEPTAVTICSISAGLAAAYCAYEPLLFVANQIGGDDVCKVAGGITDYITESNVSYFARVYGPAGGVIDSPQSSASRFGPYPAISVDLSELSGPPISVKTIPADPDPFEGYEVQSTISCRANASSALISVSGTDNYFDQIACFLPDREGACNLLVPGAEAEVQDTITVEAGEFVATLTVTF